MFLQEVFINLIRSMCSQNTFLQFLCATDLEKYIPGIFLTICLLAIDYKWSSPLHAK